MVRSPEGEEIGVIHIISAGGPDPETAPEIKFEGHSFCEITGRHPSMQRLFELVELVAKTDVTVHIFGENGTGKELVASAIHHLSSRSKKQFIRLNCSTIPATLLESTLFGHAKGSFTGAHKDQIGFVEEAEEGTLFLDEIGDVSSDIQVKLLRLLQSREYSRVGETQLRKANIRILTATNQDLRRLVQEGKIREDFYYRIHVFPLVVPPLRNRREDIELLVKHFIAVFNGRFSKEITGVSEDALEMLSAHDWPGNVRELENAIEYAFVLASCGEIRREHLPGHLSAPASLANSH
jgi:transcriptional regulator with PAS, ATPase and Fis domain